MELVPNGLLSEQPHTSKVPVTFVFPIKALQ